MVIVALVALLPTSASSAPARAAAGQAQPGSDVEEVLSYLAVRSNRIPGASDPACNDAGFAVRNRNDSDLRAMTVTRDGRTCFRRGPALARPVLKAAWLLATATTPARARRWHARGLGFASRQA